jgi:hypothetical protein
VDGSAVPSDPAAAVDGDGDGTRPAVRSGVDVERLGGRLDAVVVGGPDRQRLLAAGAAGAAETAGDGGRPEGRPGPIGSSTPDPAASGVVDRR